jgi:predicted nucleic acid-binding protein
VPSLLGCRGVSAEQLFLAAVTFGELQAGVELTRQQDPQKAVAIEGWIDAVAASYGIVPIDEVIFRRWARLMHRRSDELIEDAMIAATALVRDMTVVTRNLRDFEQFAVPTLDPFRPVG